MSVTWTDHHDACEFHVRFRRASALAVNARDLAGGESLSGPEIGEALRRARIAAIGAARMLHVA